MCSLTTKTVFVGLDYHDQSVQVCGMDADEQMLVNRSVKNDWKAIVAAVQQRCGKEVGVQAAIEACCGAANLAEELTTKAKWSVSLAHPGYVARMKHNPDKSDFSDARVLSDLERLGYLPRVWLAPEEVRELRLLVRHRQWLTKERKNLKLQIRATLREARQQPPEELNPWTKAWLAWLQDTAELSPNARLIVRSKLVRLTQLAQQIRGVERLMARQTRKDPLVQKLLTMPGIGLVTAVTMRAEIGRFDRFRTGKQLARFCGVTPRNASSGKRQADAGLIKAGNPGLRTVLVEAAHRLMRYDERWLKFAHRLSQRGKPTNVINAAIANRWLRWLFHQMQDKATAA